MKVIGHFCIDPSDPAYGDRLSLIDWLRSECRADFGLPRQYVSLIEFIPRLCAHRVIHGMAFTPGRQKEIENGLRQALKDGELQGRLITEGAGDLLEVKPTKWTNSYVWHRAKYGTDPEKPDFKYDGDFVSEEEWRAVLREAGPEGIYVLDVSNALRWLGAPELNAPEQVPAPSEAQQVSSASKRAADRERLKIALKAHLEFDRPIPPKIPRDDVVEEIERLLEQVGFHTHFKAGELADEIRPEEHKNKAGPRPKTPKNEWKMRMEAKRAQFRFALMA